jgi:hypothetical protein
MFRNVSLTSSINAPGTNPGQNGELRSIAQEAKAMAEAAVYSGPESAVLAALSNPQYEWRTVPGIARETNLEANDVISILARLAEANLVAKSRATTREGLELYASREKIREKGNIVERLLGAINNRAP